ncbi:MAG: 5'-deoxynucleotidase [Clostridia bacterium]|nr:5'-deoxynucleotidase [Clostridia bacterium]
MKYISRWGLMRNSKRENISEHSLETAIIAHGLAVMRNKRFGGNVNPEKVALLAMFHDASETITGDLPTPVKYFNPDISKSYKQVERVAIEKLLTMLPDDMREEYRDILIPDESDEAMILVKVADKLSALLKCIEEESAGNGEFVLAKNATIKAIEEMNVPEAQEFIKEFLPSYKLTLDELIN